MRVANVYDINSKTYLLKFARPDEKVFVLLESGIRVHTTQFARDKNTLPSGFSMKVFLIFVFLIKNREILK
mgnify:CR=1 FL=1